MILVSSCICLCPIHWSRVLSREWRCSWSSANRRCSNYIWMINNLVTYQGAPYIRDLTIFHVSSMWQFFQLWPHSSKNTSVHPSVCLSIHLSLTHLFHNVPVIISWNFQQLLPLIKVMSIQKVKVRCHFKITNFTLIWAFPNCNSSLNSWMATKWCARLAVA